MHTSYFTAAGWLSPVVDPLNVGSEGSQSPESQASVLVLHVQWRECIHWNAVSSIPRINSATPSLSISFPALVGIWNYRYRSIIGVEVDWTGACRRCGGCTSSLYGTSIFSFNSAIYFIVVGRLYVHFCGLFWQGGRNGFTEVCQCRNG